MATRVALSPFVSTDHQNHALGQGTSSIASLVARRWTQACKRPSLISSSSFLASQGYGITDSQACKPWMNPSAASQGYGLTETESFEVKENAGSGEGKTEALGVTETGCFTVSDETLLARGFELHCTLQGMDLDQLNDLFVKVGFPRRHKQKLERALQHTSSVCWLREVKSHKLIAFARATGDDVFNAIIWDVVVDPSYQGLGLGKAVMERLMVDLLHKGITNIGLYAEPNVVGFYKPLGYIADPQGIRAMAYSRKGK